MESFAFEQEMSIIDKLYDKYNTFAETHSEKLPEAIYIKPIIRKVLIIIFFWGGGFRDWRPEQFYRQARYFANHGMMAYTGEYRVKSRHDITMFDCVKDAKSAIRFLKKNKDLLSIDSSRIIASGGSSGGMIAACTEFIDHVNDDQDDLSFTSRPNALILYNPPLNIIRYLIRPTFFQILN